MVTSGAVGLQVTVLGGFRVRVGSTDVPRDAWGRRNAAAILKILALTPGHRIHREQLMENLWPGAEPKLASNNLHQALHVARRVLERAHPQAGEYLRLQEQMLHFSPEITVWVDLVAFEQVAAGVRARRTVRAYQSALTLYGGSLLPDDLYEPWVSERREAVEQEYLTLLEELATLQEEAGNDVEALSTLQELVAADPLREPAHRALMRLYARSGQRQHAVRQFHTLRAALARGLDVDPEPESESLLNQILSGEIARPPSSPRHDARERHQQPRHNLPAPVNTFIGREREKSEVGRLVRSARLLTLTGPGGCGKSRLSLEVASKAVDAYWDGTWLVELAPLADPLLIPQEIAGALNVREVPGQPVIDTLTTWFASREALLILDNCEHLIDACAALAETLLRSSPALTILATSREPLRIDGETTWLVPSLTLPDPNVEADVDYVLGHEAVQLFVDRARRAWPGFAVTAENAAAVGQLCYRLDGIPLALELAAARVRALTAEQIVARLSDRFQLLSGGSRASLSRQQTLRAALDWSYNLLSEQERILFRRLSVFSSGFDLEAVEAVCALPPLDEREILHLLMLLVDRSLVATYSADGAARYTLLETMREYARERLADHQEKDAMRASHARYYASFASYGAGQIRGAFQKTWIARLEREHDNVRAALEWYQQEADRGRPEEGLYLSGSLHWFWHVQGHFSEGNGRLARILASRSSEPSRGLGKALTGAGVLALAVGDYPSSRSLLDQSIAVWRELDEPEGLWEPLTWSGWIELFRSLIPEARAHHEEGLALATQVDDRWGVAMATLGLGFDAAQADEYEEARGLFLRALSMFRELDDYWGATTSLEQLASLTYRMGHFAEARSRSEEVLALEQASGDRWLEVQGQGLLGEIARAEGDFERAAAAVEITLAISAEIGNAVARAWTLRDAGFIALATGDTATARNFLQESMSLFQPRGYRLGMACCVTGFAGVAIAEQRYAEGVRLLGCAQAALDAIQMTLAPADRIAADAFTATARAALGEDAFETARTQGAELVLEDVVQTLAGSPLATL